MNGRDAEIVARLRRAYEQFSRGDFDAAIEIAHPEIEFRPPSGRSTLRGVAAMRAWMEPSAFEQQVIEPLEFTVAGHRVLVRELARNRGAASGIEMEVDSWSVWTLDDDGLAIRVETYLGHQEAEARQAAGLPPG